MVKNYLFILTLGLLSLLAQDVFAVTAVPWPVEKTQPDGTAISVYLRGDEKVHWMESMDGYTLMYDDQKYVVYAKQDERGNMVPSNIRYGNKSVQPPSAKGLRYSKDQVEALKQIWEITSDPGQQKSPGQQKIGSTVGERKALCVLVGFTNKAFGKTVEDYDVLFNQLDLVQSRPDLDTKGSVRDFFRENSYGQLDFTVTVVGPYLAPNTTSYYASREREFATFAANAANVDVNYNDFADEGVLETFHILFAGYGDEAVGNGQQIWSHKWQLATPIQLDGVTISVYSCSPELRGNNGNNITYIGVVCHELSHVFGSPDYYDTSYSDFPGTGEWDLMASGSWNDGGRQPGHINMYQKMLYEWVDPVALTAQTTITGMPPSSLSPVAYTIQANDNGELYILDNKQKTGFDASLPGHGLLIWHVHPAALGGRGSNSAHPQQLYPVMAASTIAIPNANPASYGSINGPGTPFPGVSNNRSFTHSSTPAMFTWAGLQTVAKPVTEITEAADGTVSFKFLDGPTNPVTGLNATVTGNNVQLNWTPPARDDIRGYKIFRDGTLQFSTSVKDATSYTQAGVPKGNYDYCVVVVYEVTESEKACIPVAVTTGSDEFYLPVSNLQTTAGITDINLSWMAPGGWTGIAGDFNAAYQLSSAMVNYFAGTLWNPSDLKGLNGFEISKVRFVPMESIASGATYAVMIYEVPASGDPVLISTQNVTGTLRLNAYNEITLNSPVTIDAAKGVIVGMQVRTRYLPVSEGDAYPGRNIIRDASGWYLLEDIGIALGDNYCLQVKFDGAPESSVSPKPGIPANTSFLKKDSGKKLPISRMTVNNGISQVPSVITTYHIFRDGVEIDVSTKTTYADTGLTPTTAYAYCVTVEYAGGGLSEGVCIETKTDTPYKPVNNLKAQVVADEVNLAWDPITEITLLAEGFENGIPATWRNVDQDGDGYIWGIIYSGATPQSSSSATSASFVNNVGPLTPDNWLVTPAVTLTAGNKLKYYVNAQEAGWAAEHYGVYISTSNTVPGTFTKLFEETMTAAPGKPVANPAPGTFRTSGPQYVPGAWYEREIDLSTYAGQTVYIAFRHFNCTNQFYLNLDNVRITSPISASDITYNVYEEGTAIATGLTSPQYTVSDVEAGTHNYGVTTVYSGADESEAAYIAVTVTTPYPPVNNLTAQVAADEITLTWEPQINPIIFEEGFEYGIPATWSNVDQDGDGYIWGIRYSGATPQSSSSATSASYNGTALTPDNWLVTPAIVLTVGNKLKYYVNAQDAGWPEEHYGVYISTSNTVPGTFIKLFEETLTASPGKPVDNPDPGAFRSDGPQYVPGAWYEREIDLSTYAGQTVYIAFRHFNCTDKFYLNLDNVRILSPISASDITYNVYEEGTPIATGLTSPQYTVSDAAAGTYNYCVTAVYYGTNESKTACVEAVVGAAPTYEVTIATSNNGGITSDKASAAEGDLVTLTALPDAGYEVDEVTVTKTGDDETIVAVNESGLTYTFTMPAYAVTVQATFKKTDAQVLDEIKELLEERTYTVNQATANSSAQVADWLVQQINSLILSSGVTVSAGDVTIDAFTAAIAGTEAVPAGVGGSFAFTVSLALNAASTTTISINGTITPTPYTPPVQYEVTIAASANGGITSDKASAVENELVTLTASPDAGYEVDEVKVTKTGDNNTIVAVNESGLTYTFTMPAYAVTVQATFKKTDALIVDEIKELLEGRTYTVNQATANTNAQVADWLVQQINNLTLSSGITVSAGDISISAFTAAIAGTETVPAGVSGSFTFTVSFALNAASATTGSLNGTITPITYTPPAAEETFYTLNIPSAEGLITDWGAGPHAVSEFTYVTITFRAAEGYSIANMRVYVNGAERTLTLNGEGVYELALGYLNENITITVDGIETSGSVGNMASPENGVLRVVKADGGLYVYGLTPGRTLHIYSSSGLLVYQGKAINTEQFIPLRDRGFYIIVSDGSSVKAAL